MRISLLLTSAIMLIALLFLCMSFSCDNRLKDKDFTYYKYHVGNGYSGQSYDYMIYEKDGVVIASINECNYLMMRDDTIPCKERVVKDVPREKLEQVGKLLVDAQVQKWESYYNNPDVFDGDNWSVSIQFGDQKFDSNGYMNWPNKAPFRAINEIIVEICGSSQE